MFPICCKKTTYQINFRRRRAHFPTETLESLFPELKLLKECRPSGHAHQKRHSPVMSSKEKKLEEQEGEAPLLGRAIEDINPLKVRSLRAKKNKQTKH